MCCRPGTERNIEMLQVLSLFSGIGAFEKALTNLEVPFNLLGYCEIDEHASKSYSAIHNVGEDLNLKDVTKVDTSKITVGVDILTYGFPCQDISQAGHQKGFKNDDGTLTRSGLFFEALRIITHTHPKIAIAENVKALTSSKFSEEFKIVLNSLEEAGYNNYWKVLNAKDYGIPQNRERVFVVSIRKDIDHGLFQFPEPFPLKTRLFDILEDDVDESFYLTAEQCRRLTGNVFAQANTRLQNKQWRDTLLARDYKDPKVICVAQMYPNSGNPQAGRIYNPEGISPALDTCEGGNRQVKIATAVAMRGRYGTTGKIEQCVEISDREYANALTTVQKDSMVQDRSGIRKLTPKEYFRLMGFSDSDFEKAASVNSKTQLYKQAGNSIVVDVLEELFCGILDDSNNIYV